MKDIEISANRSIKVENLLPEYKKKIPQDHKGDDFTFSVGPVVRSVPSNLKESIEKHGEDKVYEMFLAKLRIDLGMKLAEDLADKVTDPKKTKRRSGSAIQVSL